MGSPSPDGGIWSDLTEEGPHNPALSLAGLRPAGQRQVSAGHAMRRSIAIALVATFVGWSARGRACEKCESRSSDDAQIRSATLVVVVRRRPPKRYGAPSRHDYRVFVRKVLKGGFGSKELRLKYETVICETDEEIQGDSTAALLVPMGDGTYRPLLETCGATYLAVVGEKIAVDGRWLTFDEFISKYGQGR